MSTDTCFVYMTVGSVDAVTSVCSRQLFTVRDAMRWPYASNSGSLPPGCDSPLRSQRCWTVVGFPNASRLGTRRTDACDGIASPPKTHPIALAGAGLRILPPEDPAGFVVKG